MSAAQLPPMANVSNPAAYGVRWDGEGEGVEHELVNPRGTRSLYLGTRTPHTYPRWVQSPVVNPERFGLTKEPGSWREFMAIVQAFLDASQGGDETP